MWREKKEAAGDGKARSFDVSAIADIRMLSFGVQERKERVPMSRRLRAKSWYMSARVPPRAKKSRKEVACLTVSYRAWLFEPGVFGLSRARRMGVLGWCLAIFFSVSFVYEDMGTDGSGGDVPG